MVNRDNDILYFCFDSSSSCKSIIKAAQVKKTAPFGDNNGYVHFGFFHKSGLDFGLKLSDDVYIPTSGSILDLIDNTEASNILFTGHGDGGAIAQMVALRYIDCIKKFDKNGHTMNKNFYCVTYGNPICTTNEINNYLGEYKDRFLSINYDKDPLPNMCRDIQNRIFLNYIIVMVLKFIKKNKKDPLDQSKSDIMNISLNSSVNVSEINEDNPSCLNTPNSRSSSENSLSEIYEINQSKTDVVSYLEQHISHLFEPIGNNVIITDNFYHYFSDSKEFLSVLKKGINVIKDRKYFQVNEYIDVLNKLCKNELPSSNLIYNKM